MLAPAATGAVHSGFSEDAPFPDFPASLGLHQRETDIRLQDVSNICNGTILMEKPAISNHIGSRRMTARNGRLVPASSPPNSAKQEEKGRGWQKIGNPKPRDNLGVTLGGSARKGHSIIFAREEALSEIFGTTDEDQASAFLSHCLKVLNPDEAGDAGASNDERHFLLSIIRDMAPRDPVERMLAVQMAATHVATIRAGRWLATCDNLPQCEAHYTGFTKLARAFTAQVEALRKHRTGGKQIVTVQHVNVADGGQAIVGNVQTGGGGAMEDDDNPMSAAHAARRCTARSKRTGEQCKGPAIAGWTVCRFHGARGGHPPGKNHPSWRHGMRSREWINERKMLNELVRETREIERPIGKKD